MAPWFLAGVLAAGLPLWIHLLKQHKSVPRRFASLMFFERHIQSSVKHRRLKFYALLVLRLALIVLLALLFANPYFKLPAGSAGGRKLTEIVIDRSFSMRYGDHLEKAKQQALAMAGGEGKTQVAGLSNRVDLLTEITTDRAASANAIRAITPSDGTSSYAELARYLRGLPRSAGMPVEAHFFSDMQLTSMPPGFSDLALGDDLKLVLHAVGEAKAPNWAVDSVNAPARVYSSKKSRVQATVAGFGTPAARKTVTLVLNGKTVESKTIEVPENGRSQVEFAALDPNYGANRGEVRIDSGDRLPADDRMLFTIERTDPAKILFIHEQRQPAVFFRTAVETASDAGFEIEAVSPEQAVNQPLDKYAYAVLSATGTIPDALESRLKQYVSAGRGLLVALGPASVARGRVPVTGDRIGETRYSAREGERFQTVSETDRSHPAMARTDFAGVRFYQTVKMDESNARVLARLSDRSAIVIDRAVGEGRVIVFGSTFDNVSNDLPIHAAFVPFVEQVSRYLEGGEAGASSQWVGSYAELRNARDRGAAAEVIDPDGKRALSLSEASSAKTYQFDREGFFEVAPANGRRRLIAVNAERRESDLKMVPAETLSLWQGTPSRPPGDGGAPVAGEENRQSIWKWLLAALIAVALAESILADRFTPSGGEEKTREVHRQAA